MHHFPLCARISTAFPCFCPADKGTGPADNLSRVAEFVVAEFVTFRLKDGVTDDTFVQAAAAISPWLRDSTKVISRTLSRDDTGLWTDHITWTSREAGEKTAARIMQTPEFAAMGEMIDTTSITLRYARILMRMD